MTNTSGPRIDDLKAVNAAACSIGYFGQAAGNRREGREVGPGSTIVSILEHAQRNPEVSANFERCATFFGDAFNSGHQIHVPLAIQQTAEVVALLETKPGIGPTAPKSPHFKPSFPTPKQ
jgi:hypothetical protein